MKRRKRKLGKIGNVHWLLSWSRLRKSKKSKMLMTLCTIISHMAKKEASTY